jgi:hypothetical protein
MQIAHAPAGHFACDLPCDKAYLELRQPGRDGSKRMLLPGSVDEDDLPQNAADLETLQAVKEFIIGQLMLKSQHALPIKAFDNFIAHLCQSKIVAPQFKACIEKYAKNHSRAVALVSGKVRGF